MNITTTKTLLKIETRQDKDYMSFQHAAEDHGLEYNYEDGTYSYNGKKYKFFSWSHFNTTVYNLKLKLI